MVSHPDVGYQYILQGRYFCSCNYDSLSDNLSTTSKDVSFVQLLVSTDTRVRVNDTQDFPWAAIGQLVRYPANDAPG